MTDTRDIDVLLGHLQNSVDRFPRERRTQVVLLLERIEALLDPVEADQRPGAEIRGSARFLASVAHELPERWNPWIVARLGRLEERVIHLLHTEMSRGADTIVGTTEKSTSEDRGEPSTECEELAAARTASDTVRPSLEGEEPPRPLDDEEPPDPPGSGSLTPQGGSNGH